jgi:protein-S-isoprenylcysteine O-methyltransferase Ste14
MEDDMSSAHAKTMIMIALPAAIVTSTLWTQIRTPGPLPLIRTIGMVLAISGFVFWAAARIQLSKSFSIRAKATALVTPGIYSKIRNPVYLFGTIFTAGLILWVGKPIWLLALSVMVPMQVTRARKEAQVLEEKFGDAYRAYRAKTWF